MKELYKTVSIHLSEGTLRRILKEVAISETEAFSFRSHTKKTNQWGTSVGMRRSVSATPLNVEMLYKELRNGNVDDVILSNYPALRFFPEHATLEFNSVSVLFERYQIFSGIADLAIPDVNPEHLCIPVNQRFYEGLSEAERWLLLPVSILQQVCKSAVDLYPLNEHIDDLDYCVPTESIIVQTEDGQFVKPMSLSLSDLVSSLVEGAIERIRYLVGNQIVTVDFEGVWKFDCHGKPIGILSSAVT